MQYAKISQVAHFTPEQVVTNHDLAQILETSDDWIRSRTGIEARRIARQEMTSDLAIEVAKRLLAQAQLSADLLDFIIVATITPDSFMPSTAARVQAAIGASRAFAFDLTAACSGFVFALSTAEKFISSGRYQRGLVIGAETLSKTLDWTDRSTAVLFGDGAGGVLLEASERPHFLAELQRTDGARGAGLTSGLTGLSSPYSVPGANIPQLQMDGRTIFDFAMRDVTQTITEVLDMAELTSDAVDYFLLHQANYRILVKMAQKLKIDLAKFPANMMTYGNTSAASIPILLSECVADGRIKLDGSQTVLMAGFGGGLTWGTLVLTL